MATINDICFILENPVKFCINILYDRKCVLLDKGMDEIDSHIFFCFMRGFAYKKAQNQSVLCFDNMSIYLVCDKFIFFL